MSNKPVLGILLGDAAGVGPEIVAKVAAANFFDEYCRPVIIGDKRVFDRGCKVSGVEVKTQVISDVSEATWEDGIPLLDQKDLDPEEVPFGQLSIQSGRACLNMLKLGIELFQAGKIDGFSFAPLNKAGMIQAGCQFEGEHHYMAHLLNHTAPFGEINVVDNMWTTRTTSHIPISKVSESLSIEKIMRAITLANTTLKTTGTERYTGKFDAPTLSEIGDYEDVEVPVWRGVVASPEMDDAAVAFYSEALKKVSETEAWKTEYLDRNMLISDYMDAETATEYMTQFEADYLASLEAAE